MRLAQIVALVAASAGAAPLLLCALHTEMTLLLSNGSVTLAGILYASTSPANLGGANTTAVQAALETANASVGVLYALSCAWRVSAYFTIVGAFRSLWLITIVTSSCSYTSARSLSPRLAPAIPNDLTLIALAVGGVFFALSLCVSLCKKKDRLVSRDGRVLAMEVLLICGALGIRYQSDFDSILRSKTDIGWSLWYVCCHLTTLIIVVLSNGKSTDPNRHPNRHPHRPHRQTPAICGEGDSL